MPGENPLETTVHAIRNSHMLRLLAVGLLALILQIPISMIGGLIGERQERRDAAVSEVTEKWGRTQRLVGPALVVPYLHHWEDTVAKVTRSETRRVVVLPKSLRANGKLATETRTRGIFSIPVYSGDVELTGSFARPELSGLGIDPTQVAWNRAQLALGISDPRAIQNAAAVVWKGAPVAFLPGTDDLTAMETGIHAPVDASGAGELPFRVALSLQGSVGFYLAPFGETTVLALEGNSANPSFQGAWLPKQREISPERFTASWEIPFLGRNFPQAWPTLDTPENAIGASQFGVEIVAPVDHYRMAERSVKYAGLFILLTFATVWLIEVLARVQVHPIQYLLLGSALCLFYLLELSLAEHVGFPSAYAIASIAVISLIGAYSQAILRRRALALTVAAGVAGLYGYLYVLLMNEDSALLIGSIGLFAILASVMFVTRNVDWYAMGTGRIARTEGA
ncbi:MAG TPA: cell envelope integrity protein CreD [Myxococcota bacterium]|jgi:inner membrane protein|nr:cell envelope integrity protein CreD [Myxococcota bacterium]